MSNIIFYANHMSERGTEIALYDYAYFSQEYLGLEL